MWDQPLPTNIATLVGFSEDPTIALHSENNTWSRGTFPVSDQVEVFHPTSSPIATDPDPRIRGNGPKTLLRPTSKSRCRPKDYDLQNGAWPVVLDEFVAAWS